MQLTKIKCTVLIDLGSLKFEADEHYTYLQELVQVCYAIFTHKMYSNAVALSSGSGRLIEFPKSCQKVRTAKASGNQTVTPDVTLRLLMKMYIKRKGLELNSVDPKRLTKVALSHSTRNVLSLVDCIMCTMALSNLFKNIELNNCIASDLETTIYKAANMIPLSENDVDIYNHSWLHTEYICNLDASGDSTFLILITTIGLLGNTSHSSSNH